jgi:hypothetical protein
MSSLKDELEAISENIITNEFPSVTFRCECASQHHKAPFHLTTAIPPPPPPLPLPPSFMAVDAAVTYDPPKISVDQPLSAKMIASGTSPLTLSPIYPSFTTTILHLTMPPPLQAMPFMVVSSPSITPKNSHYNSNVSKSPLKVSFLQPQTPSVSYLPARTQLIFSSQLASTSTSLLPIATTTFPSPLCTRVWSRGARMRLLPPCLGYC